MHISLDQAIGRQPRLNRVGQSLLNIASGASAAYSLRSLTGDEPKAVRIRRDGDNEERDFTTAEIVNEAADWTNGKQETTLPADVATSAGAYSLRKVKSDYTGPAVRIRRESDDVEVNVSFDTNDEVSTSSPIEDTTEQGGESGSTTATTLGEFISGTNAAVHTWYDQSGNSKNATQTTDDNQPLIAQSGNLLTAGITFDGTDDFLATGQSVITQSNTGSFSYFGVSTIATDEAGYFFGSAGNASTVGSSLYAQDDSKFSLSNGNTASRDNITRSSGENLVSACYTGGRANLRVNGGGTSVASATYSFNANTNFTIGNRESGSSAATFLAGSIKEIIAYDADQTNNRFKIESNINNHYTIYTATQNGFVNTWYDQSGNGNDATQSSATIQPKIVGDGLLLKDTNQNPAIEFKRLADIGSLKLILGTSIPPMGTTNFAVVDYRRSFSYHLAGLGGGTIRIGRYSSNQFRIVNGGATVASTDTSFTTDAVHLATANIAASGGTSKAFVDGVEVISNDFSDATDNFEQIFRGDNDSNNPVFLPELIIYASDQTSNRTAIETNIANEYGITLS